MPRPENNTAPKSVVFLFEYGPFGKAIRTSGPMARANPFRFSTKYQYQDFETDLLYYGCRFYDTCSGRWLSRDSIKEIERQYSATLKNK
jgi:RHS repeat-associated protein